MMLIFIYLELLPGAYAMLWYYMLQFVSLCLSLYGLKLKMSISNYHEQFQIVLYMCTYDIKMACISNIIVFNLYFFILVESESLYMCHEFHFAACLTLRPRENTNFFGIL